MRKAVDFNLGCDTIPGDEGEESDEERGAIRTGIPALWAVRATFITVDTD